MASGHLSPLSSRRAFVGAIAAAGVTASARTAFAADDAAPAGCGTDIGLDGPYDPANPFAQILRGTAPVSKAYEDEHVLAFMPLRMETNGHTLVISKTSKARNILYIEPADLARVMDVVQKVARGQRDAFKADGMTVRQNNGTASDQTVAHLHFHVIPRYLKPPLPPFNPTRAEMDATAALLAEAIKVLDERKYHLPA